MRKIQTKLGPRDLRVKFTGRKGFKGKNDPVQWVEDKTVAKKMSAMKMVNVK